MTVRLIQCPAHSISNIQVVGKSYAMTALHWPDFMLTIAIESCPFNLCISVEEVACTPIVDKFVAVMSDNECATWDKAN